MLQEREENMSEKFVHHVCIQTNDYKKSLHFYTEILGFDLIEETVNFHNRYYNSWLRLGSFYIELQTGKIGEDLPLNNAASQGIVHLCLWVKDLVKELDYIKKMGFQVILKNNQEIYAVENGSLCKLVAPEGTIIELRDNKGI